MKLLVSLLVVFFSLSGFAKTGDGILYLPVQDSGRVKPFDTFARETLELVYGKETYKPAESSKKIEAHWVVLTWMLSPESWVERPLFEVKNKEILAKLKLPSDKKHFSGKELFKAAEFGNLLQELQNKRETKEKLTPYFQAVQRIENQFFVFQEMASGNLLKVYPVPGQEAWVSVAQLPAQTQPVFFEISKNIATYLGTTADGGDASKTEEAGKNLDQAVLSFKELARQSDPVHYNVETSMKWEVFYNQFHPFRWTYICYLIASLILLFVWVRGSESKITLAWAFIWLGFALHTFGFGLRIYLAGRAPVTNMYETVIWTSYGVIIFSMILEYIYKYRVMLLGGALMGLFAMIVADFAPAVLDPSLQPLEAVLRSNYWLVVHVMTITISYAAFLLAFGLGDLGLIYYILGEDKHADKIQKITTGIYRAMQIGVAFLAPGIILGGIWADYSWGRFWGWDPKETWALIALLGYIAVLHARLVGWLKNFGMIASGVITFSLVVMAWYGVNFVLGAGLHSYGFGAGGVEYVSAVVGLHILFCAYAYVIHVNRKTNDKKAA
jgi:ABC-type transport system involved in cytochrome c biogenesis permease subunit